MVLDGISKGFPTDTGIPTPASMLRTKGDSNADPTVATENPSAPAAEAMQSNRTSMMANHFANAESKESRYIAARKAAFQSDSNMTNRQNAVLAVTVAEMALMTASGMSTSTAQYLAGVRSERRIREEQRASTTEASESNLDEMKKDIEQMAQEATRQGSEGNSRAELTEEAISSGTASGLSVSPAAPLTAPAASKAPTPPTAPSVAQTGAEAGIAATPDNSTSLAAAVSAASAAATTTSAMSIDITV